MMLMLRPIPIELINAEVHEVANTPEATISPAPVPQFYP